MSEQSEEEWQQKLTAKCTPYLAGTIDEAWNRCLPIWRDRGRIEDYPRDVRRPSYTPWWGKSLAYKFASKFRDDYRFLIAVLDSDDDFQRMAAVDMLHYLCYEFVEDPIPSELLSLHHPLPELIKSEVSGDRYARGKEIETVGDLLSFDFVDDENEPIDTTSARFLP